MKLGMGEDDDGAGDKKVGMLKFDNDVDMTVKGADEDEGDDEDLEGGASYKPKDGDRDARMAALVEADGADEDEEETKVEVKMDVDGAEEEEEDELEAFMNNVQKEVKNVDRADKAKLGAKGSVLDPEAVEDEEDEAESEDEVEKVGMSAAEILA